MRQILPIAGAVVGSFFPGMGTQIGYAIGSLIGNIVDPIEMQGRKLGDAPSQVAAEGGARAIVFGKGCIRATVIIERGGRRVVKQRDKSGGKGGGPTTVNERALWTYAIGLGEPVAAILRIWENEKLVYDVRPESTIPKETAEFAKLFRFYDGAEDQLPDPGIEALYTDPTDAPYYRGTAYMVFPQRDITDFGESVPVYRVEVASALHYENPEVIPQLRQAAGFLTGGGAPGKIHQELVDFSAPTDPINFDGVIGHWFRFCLDLGSVPPDRPADGRLIVYSGPGQTGDVVWDTGWRGDPSNQSEVDSALAVAGLSPFAGVIEYAEPVYVVGLGQMYFTASPVTLNSASMSGYSVRMLAYNPDTTFRISSNIDRGKPDEIPSDAIAVIGFPGVYKRADDSLIAVEWVDPPLPPPDIPPVAIGIPIPLSSVIAALHGRCGHASSDYDVSELGELIDGVVIESTQTGAEAINSLIGTHWADPADYDGKIRYIKRGAPVVRTLTIDDLIDEPETWQRNNAIEYPAKVHFFGQVADIAYASVKATSARYSADVKVVGEVSIASPETYNTSHRPYENAAIIHKIMWTEAGGEVTWRVTDQHLDLVPTDCVGLSWGGQLWRARITQIESDPGEMKLKMMLDRQSAYTANLTEIPVPPAPTPPQTSIMADTALAVMDIPALVDASDTLHIVTAMSGETDVWAGANLQRSMDAGASFTPVSSSTLNAIMGTLNVAVTAASPHYTDTTNAIEVLLYTDDEIESLTDEVFLSEGGAFALSWDDSGTQRWEMMQYRDAELIAHKTYRLTTLHRGRLGTEAAAHPIGATFVLLDSAIQAHPTQSAWIGQDLTHRAVSTGHTPDDADEQTLTYEGNSQREFPVANLLLSRAGTDVTATAIPRHRFGTDVAPLRSANWVGYRWTATDGTSTITRDGTAYSETFDCTGWASPVTVTVAQLNRITGAGPSVSEDIA